MAESPRRADLRLSISAGAPFRELARELAGKFAEYAGARPADATRMMQAIESWFGAMPNGASLELQLAAEDHELVVTANSGPAAKRATCPLPD